MHVATQQQKKNPKPVGTSKDRQSKTTSGGSEKTAESARERKEEVVVNCEFIILSFVMLFVITLASQHTMWVLAPLLSVVSSVIRLGIILWMCVLNGISLPWEFKCWAGFLPC